MPVAPPPNVMPRKSPVGGGSPMVPNLGNIDSLTLPAGPNAADILQKRRSSHDLRPLSSRRSSYRGGAEGDRVSKYIAAR